jgi:hypothetical protein
MYVDFIVAVDSRDKNAYEKQYPFQAVQVHKLNQYPPPPFDISRPFSKAFNIAVKEYGVSKIESPKTLKVSKKILGLTIKQL